MDIGSSYLPSDINAAYLWAQLEGSKFITSKPLLLSISKGSLEICPNEEGDVKNPTFGAGIKFNNYGFDFGYTSGPSGHPRSNTMFFSLSLGL